MSSDDVNTVLRGTLARFHRNACYPEAMPAELDQFAKQISAIFEAERDVLLKQLEKKQKALEQISRMQVRPDDKINRMNLAAACQIAFVAITDEQGSSNG